MRPGISRSGSFYKSDMNDVIRDQERLYLFTLQSSVWGVSVFVHHSPLSSSSLSFLWTLLSWVLSAGLSGRVLFDFHSIVISNCPWRCQWRSVSRTSSFVCLYLQDPNFTASCSLSTPDHNSWTFQYWRVSVHVNSSAKIQSTAVPILTPLTLFVIHRHISLRCLCNSWIVI